MKLFYFLYRIFCFHPYLGIFVFMPCFNAWACLKMDVLLDFVCTSICTYDFFNCNSTCLFLAICWLCVFPQTHTFTFPSQQQSVLHGLQFPAGRIVMAF